jgi:hypothetical protein
MGHGQKSYFRAGEEHCQQEKPYQQRRLTGVR